jgi:hypothetical protein
MRINVIEFDNNNSTGELEEMKPSTLDRTPRLDPLKKWNAKVLETAEPQKISSSHMIGP